MDLNGIPASHHVVGGIAEMLRLRESSDSIDSGASTSAPLRRTVLVIDRSPSMDFRYGSTTRLDAAKGRAIEYAQASVVENAYSEIAIVAFSEHGTLICPFTECSKLQEIERCVKSIRSSQCTNIAAGLSMAFELFQKTGGPQRGELLVHLLTDGDHNAKGDPRVEASVLKRFGAVIDAVGIGGNASEVNTTLLQQIASDHPEGGKRYQFISDPKRLSLHYQKLAGRLTL